MKDLYFKISYFVVIAIMVHCVPVVSNWPKGHILILARQEHCHEAPQAKTSKLDVQRQNTKPLT